MGLTALIVDDSYAVRTALRRILTGAGYRVSEASSGAEALQLAQLQHLDLITMDIDIPGMDGVDAISVLRSGAETPIIAISANLTDDVRSDLRKRGIHHLVEKPFSPREVLVAISRARAGNPD